MTNHFRALEAFKPEETHLFARHPDTGKMGALSAHLGNVIDGDGAKTYRSPFDRVASEQPLVVYIAHPLGNTDEIRERNHLLASQWVVWAQARGVVPVCGWVALSLGAGPNVKPDYINRCLHTDLQTIKRCDQVWLCGALISPGMALEKAFAEYLGKVVVDFTGYAEPPVLKPGEDFEP